VDAVWVHLPIAERASKSLERRAWWVMMKVVRWDLMEGRAVSIWSSWMMFHVTRCKGGVIGPTRYLKTQLSIHNQYSWAGGNLLNS